MSLTKLRSLASAFGLTNKNALISRLSMHRTPAMLLSCIRRKATTTRGNDDGDDDLSKPIKFSSSPAATWDPVASRMGATHDDRPWFQPYVVIVSVATFMIYFFILREENDIDEKLTRDLSDHFNEEQKRNLKRSQEASMEAARKAMERRGEQP